MLLLVSCFSRVPKIFFSQFSSCQVQLAREANLGDLNGFLFSKYSFKISVYVTIANHVEKSTEFLTYLMSKIVPLVRSPLQKLIKLLSSQIQEYC